MKLVKGLVVAATTFCTISSAQTVRDLGSHEHGSAILNIAIDDTLVVLELESPWDNFVGFEHAPHTDEQHALVDDVLAQLNRPDEIFLFSGADCVSSEVDIESAMSKGDDDNHGDDDHHGDEKGHAEEHDDHHKEENGHKGEQEEQHESDHVDDESESVTHTSLLVTYSFECNDATQLASIDVQILERWRGFKELDVRLIGPVGQTLLELVPGQSVVDLALVQ